MATRFGAVVVFHKGISQRDIEEQLRQLKLPTGEPAVKHTHVQAYEDEHGGPVFYIP